MSVASLRKELKTWLDADRGLLRGGTRIYSRREWGERGETYGRKAALTLTIEGSALYAALNHGEPSWECQSQLTDLAARHGFHYEMGYSWSVHFYKDNP